MDKEAPWDCVFFKVLQYVAVPQVPSSEASPAAASPLTKLLCLLLFPLPAPLLLLVASTLVFPLPSRS